MLLIAPAPGRAQPARERIALEWSRAPGAEGCIDAAGIVEAVERALGAPAFSAGELGRTIEVAITPRAAAGFDARIAVRGADGEALGARRLRSNEADCRQLDRALTLFLAVLIDPTSALAGGTSDPPPPTAEVPPPAPAPPHAPPEPPAEPSPEPERADAGPALEPLGALGVEGVWGLLPGVAFGPRIAVGLSLDRWFALEASAVVFPESAAPDVSGGSAVLRAAGGALTVCAGGEPSGWLRLDACAHTRILALIAEGSGFPLNDPAVVRPEVAPGFELRAALRGPLFGRLTVGLWVPLVRDDFYVELPDGARRSVHRAFPVAGAVSLEIGLGG